MLEVDCSVLTPHAVFKASGHVDKFTDWMCKDPKFGDILRADHFVEETLETRLQAHRAARPIDDAISGDKTKVVETKSRPHDTAARLEDAIVKEYEEILARIDNYNGEELGDLIKKHDMRCPRSGLLPTAPVSFNLMFQTSIGPSSNLPGFLRPETAQGQFMNFSKLLEFNMGKMPFASASIGKSYRNEISPRAGLLRVREFLMAEIEHYVDPVGGKKHHKFHEIESVSLGLLDRDTQLNGQTTIRHVTVKEAVEKGIVDNETLGYFLARISLFLEKIGIDMTKLRFRQHMANEMAHYACDCWDAELHTSSGWVECVGCADRSAYDLTVHSQKTDKQLIVRERLAQPRIIEEWVVSIDKKRFGPYYKKDGKAVEAAINNLSQEQRKNVHDVLKSSGKVEINVPGLDKAVEIGSDMLVVTFESRSENVREYTPNVIEPSFGIGRILFALCEHNYWIRATEDPGETRGVNSNLMPLFLPSSQTDSHF
jgi:glycyl-tRNA synthetase